jgi:hypothetical protein
LQAALVRAGAGIAGAARHIEPDDRIHAVKGAGADWVRRAKRRDQRFAERRGDMHRAAVIGNHDRGSLKQRNKLAKVCFSAEIQTIDLASKGDITWAAGDDYV